MSPVDSLESPHSYTGDASTTVSTAATSPTVLSSPASRQMLPPVSHMLGQQPGWAGMSKHGYNSHIFGLVSHQMGGAHPGMGGHHSQGAIMAPMNVTMSREQLPPIVTFQMMPPGAGQPLLKQSHGQNQNHGQQGPGPMHCGAGLVYQMSDQMGVAHGMPHPLQHHHGVGHGGMDGQARPLPSYPTMQSPVDKYPTPPSQHSYTTAGSEGTTPGQSAHPPSEHPYLTPSPDSPEAWSSSSPHSNSDWSDVTTSPTPLGNAHHALAPAHHTHIPEQRQAQAQPGAQPPQMGNMQVFA